MFMFRARNAYPMVSGVRVYPISRNEQRVVTSQKTCSSGRSFVVTSPNIADRKTNRRKKKDVRRPLIRGYERW